MTRLVFSGEHPLTLVSHDLQGEWQFLDDGDDGDEELRDINDAILVHLAHIVQHFPEVEELADLPVGWIAWRDDTRQPWTREPQPPDWALE